MTLAAPMPVVEQADFWSLFFPPMLKPEQAAEFLDDVHRRLVLDLCEEGKLRAINIASRDDTRREVRIYRYSAQWLAEATRRKCKAPKHPPVETLLPHSRPNLTLREVAQFLACDERHVRNLAMITGGPASLTGPQISERHNRISRPALIAFLNAREINALQPR